MTDKLFDYKTMRADIFFWSVARRELFTFCERACFYHYYGASGGFDGYSDPDTKKIYLLKKLIPGRLWLDNIFSKSLRETLTGAGRAKNTEEMVGEFSRRLIREFHLGRRIVEAREWQSDPGKLNLTELYYNEVSADKYFAGLWTALESRFKSFSASNLPEILYKVDNLDWKRIPVPASFAIGRLQLWLAPDLIWRDGDCISILNLNGGGQNEDKRNTYAALNVIFAEEKFKTSPEKVISLFFNDATGQTELHGLENLNISRAIEDISASAAPMLEKISEDGTVQGINFAESAHNCAGCRFREFCGGISS
ncbi:MAG: hypothetical protein WCV67_14615 [Victivallaceae bacterium]